MRIGELAGQTKLSKDTIRFYEKIGLVEGERLPNGYRDFGPEMVTWLHYVRTAQTLGFSLAEIATHGEALRDAPDSAAALSALLVEKVQVIDERMAELSALRAELTERIGTGCPLRPVPLPGESPVGQQAPGGAGSGTNRVVTDSELRFRVAGADDAAAVAELHGDSWRRHYRGAYADAFLDDESHGYLDAMWAKRLAAREGTRTTVAEYDGKLVGLAHVVFDADPKWGALVDNLHVRAPLKRQGIGSQLLALTAETVQGSGIYLWVLEQNTAAQAFYEARRGIRGERKDVPPPGGEPHRLNGTPTCFRYYWPDPAVLGVPD